VRGGWQGKTRQERQQLAEAARDAGALCEERMRDEKMKDHAGNAHFNAISTPW